MARSSLPTHVSQTARRQSAADAPPADLEEEGPAGPSVWRPWTAFAFSLVALGISVYLTIAHYSASIQLSCPNKGAINCEAVTHSPESMVFGVLPVAVLGLAFYTVVAVLNAPPLWRSPWRLVAPLRVATMVVGMGFVIYLIFAEAFQIHAICLWCTAVHVCTFVIFMLVVTGWQDAIASSADRS